MLERIFVKDYFRNPFFWWAVLILILTTFYAQHSVNQILQAIIIYSLYIPILFIFVTITVYLSFTPIRKGIAKLYSEKKSAGIGYSALLCGAVFSHVVYFLIDPFFIFSKLSPEVVVLKDVFQYGIDLKTLFEYFGVPLIYAFSLTVTKTRLLNDGQEIDGPLVMNWKILLCLIAVNSILYFVTTILLKQLA